MPFLSFGDPALSTLDPPRLHHVGLLIGPTSYLSAKPRGSTAKMLKDLESCYFVNDTLKLGLPKKHGEQFRQQLRSPLMVCVKSCLILFSVMQIIGNQYV